MDIHVTAAPLAHAGRLRFGNLEFPCALGRSGIVTTKREGDGGTPTGRFALRELRWRADRLAKPATSLRQIATAREDGWCDAPDDPAYNRPVILPHGASAEKLWREDHLYDIVVPLGYNDDPVMPGAGSAIFLHLAKEEGEAFGATEGCVALRLADMLALLSRITPETFMEIVISSAA